MVQTLLIVDVFYSFVTLTHNKHLKITDAEHNKEKSGALILNIM